MLSMVKNDEVLEKGYMDLMGGQRGMSDGLCNMLNGPKYGPVLLYNVSSSGWIADFLSGGTGNSRPTAFNMHPANRLSIDTF